MCPSFAPCNIEKSTRPDETEEISGSDTIKLVAIKPPQTSVKKISLTQYIAGQKLKPYEVPKESKKRTFRDALEEFASAEVGDDGRPTESPTKKARCSINDFKKKETKPSPHESTVKGVKSADARVDTMIKKRSFDIMEDSPSGQASEAGVEVQPLLKRPRSSPPPQELKARSGSSILPAKSELPSLIQPTLPNAVERALAPLPSWINKKLGTDSNGVSRGSTSRREIERTAFGESDSIKPSKSTQPATSRRVHQISVNEDYDPFDANAGIHDQARDMALGSGNLDLNTPSVATSSKEPSLATARVLGNKHGDVDRLIEVESAAASQLFDTKYTYSDAKNRREPSEYVYTVVCYAKAARYDNVYNQLWLVYRGISRELRETVDPPIPNTTVNDYIRMLDSKKALWFQLSLGAGMKTEEESKSSKAVRFADGPPKAARASNRQSSKTSTSSQPEASKTKVRKSSRKSRMVKLKISKRILAAEARRVRRGILQKLRDSKRGNGKEPGEL